MVALAWWDNESLWESDAADTVARPTEDAAFDRIRTQCHDYITAMQRMYATLDYGVIRDIVLNKRALSIHPKAFCQKIFLKNSEYVPKNLVHFLFRNSY